jgi:ornithine decarboxylase
LWLTHLPDVTPFYAVKCNDDAIMMRYMRDYYPQLGFDCASIREIETALPISGARDIIYAQPCKKIEDIKIAAARGVRSTVVDSVEEVEKLREARWDGEVLVRLLVDDRGSKQPFGKKFGAPAAWLPRIYDAARAGRLNMTGYSFHVGSICGDPAQYSAAIANCARAASLAAQYGYGTTKVDIGGGFVPNNRDFAAIAKHVRSAASTHFPDRAVKFIAEPGRFFAAPTHTLYTTVIGKKPVYPEPSRATEAAWRITVDESVYGSFSNIPFDGQKPVLERVRPAIRDEKRRPTIVFGRTCDSGDLIDAAARMYEVQVGDILRVRNMGAYTTVTASEFNGFPKAHKIYDQLR